MKLLAIDTATREGSVAFSSDGEIVERLVQGPADRTLMPTILELCDLAQLDGVGVDLGPGMFTSMRVGIATAKTLAAALGLRVAGVPSLDVIARAAGRDVVACLAAGRGEVYAARYRALPFERMTEIAIVPEASPAGEIAGGVPRARMLARIALELFERGEAVEPNEIEPLYVRRTDAEIDWEVRGGIARPDRVKARGE